MNHPVKPDDRYFVVRGRLWRMTNPGLDAEERTDLVTRLMRARRAICDAKRGADLEAEAAAHKAVDEVKRALGERGPVWWDDGSPDLNRHMVREDRALPPRRILNCPKPQSSTWTERSWIPSISMPSPGTKRW